MFRGRGLEVVGFPEVEFEELFHTTDIVACTHYRVISGEVEKRITDDLARAVVCQLSPSRRRNEIGAKTGEPIALLVKLWADLAAASSVDWTVLEKEENILVRVGATGLELDAMQGLLEQPCGVIWQGSAEVVVENRRKHCVWLCKPVGVVFPL